MRLLRFPAAVLLAALTLPGCDQVEAQSDFERDARALPSGITRTGAQGAVLSTDPDDWRLGPVFAGRASVQPFFPNPLPQGSAIGRISVTLFAPDGAPVGLVLYARSSTGTLRRLDERATPGLGTYELVATAGMLGSVGLHRLVVADAFGEVVTYGDVQVE